MLYLGSFVCRREVPHDRVIFLLRECTWNALVVILGTLTFVDTGSLDYLPRWVIYHPSGSTLVTASGFLFPLLLTPSDIVPLSSAC